MARLLKSRNPVGVHRLRLYNLARKWGVQWRNEWALDREVSTEATLEVSDAWSTEKKESIMTFGLLRSEFITDLALNECFDGAGDESESFKQFLDRWESIMGPEKKNWPVALAFEKFPEF